MLLAAPPSRRTRTTVVGPPAASAPDGVSPGRARHQGAGQGSGACGAHRGVVGEQFDEQAHRVECVGAADETREGGVHRGEHLQHQVVAGAQVGTLVAEDGGDLAVGESVVSVPSLTTTRLRTPGRQ